MSGFSRSATDFQQRIADQAGLWDEFGAESGWDEKVTGFSVDIAIAELRRLMALGRLSDSGAQENVLKSEKSGNIESRLFIDNKAQLDLFDHSSSILRSISSLAAQGVLAGKLRELSADNRLLHVFELEECLGEDTSYLAAVAGFLGLQRFMLFAHEILEVDSFIPGFFKEAGRFQVAALGPYFSNIFMLIRNADDIFALIDGAAADTDEKQCELWSVILSSQLPEAERGALIDALGDRAMISGLEAQLNRTVRWLPFERRFGDLRRIRDALLDLGELQLAEKAQQALAGWSASSAVEWLVLGIIRGSLGDFEGAEKAFERSLELDPRQSGAIERLTAMRSGSFEQYSIRHGYHSSPVRAWLRIRARGLSESEQGAEIDDMDDLSIDAA
jgi:tetratricopeptide (TPR) repeat protein